MKDTAARFSFDRSECCAPSDEKVAMIGSDVVGASMADHLMEQGANQSNTPKIDLRELTPDQMRFCECTFCTA